MTPKRSEQVLKFFIISSVFFGCQTMGKKSLLKNHSLFKKGRFFEKEYVKPKVDFNKYKYVYLEKINLDFLDKNSIVNSDYFSEDLTSLARDLRLNIKSALKDKYIFLSRARGNTLVIKTAITKLVSLLGGNKNESLDPVSRLLGLRESQTEIEVVLLDGQTNEVLGEVSDFRIIPQRRSRPSIADPWEANKKAFAEFAAKLEGFISGRPPRAVVVTE